MRRNLLWMAIALGLLLGVGLIQQPETCLACSGPSNPPPPTCSANMTAMTVRKADDRQAWWPWSMLDKREERTLKVYLGLNRNSGTTPVSYEYQIATSGQWLPTSIQPITGTGSLGFPGDANHTIEITIPYSVTDQGDLNLTATVSSPSCVFTPNTVTTSVRLNEQGPTVWPISSRMCPVAGEKPTFRFGVRNPGDQPQSYTVLARANPEFSGDHTPILGGEGNPSGQAGLHLFPDMILKGGEAKEIQVTCETFGFCLTGSESRVQIEVSPAAGSAEQFDTAVASSSATIRDPQSVCPALEDWWFIMAPGVFWTLVGVPVAAALLGAVWYFWPRKTISVDPNKNDPNGSSRGTKKTITEMPDPKAASGQEGTSLREKPKGKNPWWPW